MCRYSIDNIIKAIYIMMKSLLILLSIATFTQTAFSSSFLGNNSHGIPIYKIDIALPAS